MKPFLKWAGGKRWLFTKEFISKIPEYNRYIEPFIGGGAGFFALEPKESIISDANKDLINLYMVVRDDPVALQGLLANHQALHCKDYYYEVRASEPSLGVEKAARFLYLNRTCWNGLYRLNREGRFNVPIGTKSQVLFDDDDFLKASAVLQRSDIRNADFEEVICEAASGDLLFVDPPYTVAHNKNGFVKYNEKIFSWDDQIRLRNAVVGAINRGASLLLTNADHESVRELYSGLGVVSQLSRPSVISGITKGRSAITELMVRV